MLRSYLPAWVCLVGALFSSSVQAGPVFSADELLFDPSGVTVKLTNYEGIGIDNGGDGILQVGDSLRGVFRVTTAEPQSGGAVRQPTGFELTGVFETVVLSATPNALAGIGTVPDSYSDFTFGPSAGFASDFGLPTGTMIAFSEDFTPDFDDVFSAANPAAAEAFASNGSLYATFGAKPGSVHGDDYFWVASGYADLADFPGAPITTEFAASVELLSQPGTSLTFSPSQNQPPVAAFAGLNFEDIFNELAFQGNVTSNPTGAPYPLRSQDPAQFKVVPEPSTLGIWGCGLACAGLVVSRRRRSRK